MVQNGHHSGTLRAMLESIPAIDPELPASGAENNAANGPEKAAQDLVVPDSQKNSGPDLPGAEQQIIETGGPEGPEPTRFGDWERKGRCIDF